MSLKQYFQKRDFSKTPEPKGKVATKTTQGKMRFVVQKHDASRLHYDFRLEMEGTLKSWAVPKGVPFAKGEKRLAVQTEDHPLSYIDFEGVIPEGQYGGGTVMVWDFGTYEPLSDSPEKDLASGKLHFVLKGKKLQGEWYLVRLRDENQWLLIKGHSDMRPVSKKLDDTSALSKKSMAELSAGKRVWQSSPQRNRSERFSRISSHRTKTPQSEIQTIPRSRRLKAELQTKSSLKFVEPMKAKLVASPPRGNWIYEIKFDGFRALALIADGNVQLLSRNEKDFNDKFPEVVEALEKLKLKDAIIDGEIVALDDKGRSSFQLLQAYELNQERPPILFYAFDLLRLNGKDVRSLPLHERKALLETVLQNSSKTVRYSASLTGKADTLLQKVRKLGLEGLIGKRADSSYEAGKRSGTWIKLKLHYEQEMVIGGYTDPEGTRPYFGALLVGFYKNKKLHFAGKVGTGFNFKLLQSLHARFREIARDDCPFANLPEKRTRRYGQAITRTEMKRCHWVDPILVGQIKFAEWTRDEKLRQPVFLGLREDKDANEVVREKIT